MTSFPGTPDIITMECKGHLVPQAWVHNCLTVNTGISLVCGSHLLHLKGLLESRSRIPRWVRLATRNHPFLKKKKKKKKHHLPPTGASLAQPHHNPAEHPCPNHNLYTPPAALPNCTVPLFPFATAPAFKRTVVVRD